LSDGEIKVRTYNQIAKGGEKGAPGVTLASSYSPIPLAHTSRHTQNTFTKKKCAAAAAELEVEIFHLGN
jgi:hypothetical protein